MILKCTNISKAKAVCTFLDLRISVFRGHWTIRNSDTSFDKHNDSNDFSFYIVKYPDLSGNIPLIKPSYGVYTSLRGPGPRSRSSARGARLIQGKA